ncbi:hypothetical protein LPY66_12755 [Dehalobacter sp. DCM]|uniref:hypothetical protein n=1 Tax=Dehalobacter sp. DCM TaxID=2907827 RepID=UPI0030819FF0|nr:hypothetical protein LPY66_12755 [Dehalobacter sp. DCM]
MIPIKFIPFIYAILFAIIMIAVVPRAEIRRLSIYGILFGAVADVIVVVFGVLTGSFSYINYEELGLFGLHFFAPISWALFFIIYFYFLPKLRIYQYIYTFSAVFYSMMFCQMISKLGVLKLTHGIIDSIIPFVIWIPLATWGFLKIEKTDR